MKHILNPVLKEYMSPKCETLLALAEGVLCASGDSEFSESTIDGFTNQTESYW